MIAPSSAPLPVAGSRLLRAAAWIVPMLLLALPAAAHDIKLEAKLIWGTNEPKSPNPAHKPVEKEVADKLRKVFKWKNYFVVNRIEKTVPSRKTGRFVLSNKCTVEVTELEGPKVGVKLFGEGKELHKATKGLAQGEWFTYAGDDKNDTAWFVIIRQLN
ncbi:MAG: hypothetical protein JXQ71_10250 [Verrucomicrobia bacterium]|nr:hypothetical protein [Verrucomicrobiota bacterium]